VNIAAKAFLASGSLIVLLGCAPSAKSAQDYAFTYKDPTIPVERHDAVNRALKDMATGSLSERMRGEQYLTTMGSAMNGKLTNYVAQLLKSSNHEVRDSATRVIIFIGGMEAIPLFIDFLGSSNVMIRHDAIAKLTAITGETFGYEYDGPEDGRNAAQEAWRTWYSSALKPAAVK